MAVRIGIVGTGAIAEVHMQRLSTLEEAQMVAFCDLVKEKAQAAANRYGGSAYTDGEQMLEEEHLDALYVCLPPYAHGPVELSAVEKGVHLFIEKPVAISLETAKEIEAAAKKKGIITSVAYHFRYMETTEMAQALLKDRPVGMALGYWIGGLPATGWWRVRDRSGGQYVEQATHIFDLARLLVGEVKRVYGAAGLRVLGDVASLDVDDVGTCVLEFKNGAVGSVSTSCMISQGYSLGLHVFARDLAIEVGPNSLKVTEPGVSTTRVSRTDAYLAESKAFLQAIEKGDPSGIRADYSEGVKSLQISVAVLESAAKHQPVTLE